MADLIRLYETINDNRERYVLDKICSDPVIYFGVYVGNVRFKNNDTTISNNGNVKEQANAN